MNEKEHQMESISQEIINLKLELSSATSEIGDYRIIKTYEARINNEKDPYDTKSILAKRQEIRDKINALQRKLDTLQAEEESINAENN